MDGLIYVAIIALWAVFLVGQLLRHHDDVSEAKSADRFSTAMRILARRTVPAPDRRYIVKPPTPAATDTASRETFVKGNRTAAARRAQTMARRRRTLLTLFLLAIATGAGSLAGFFPLPVTALPAGLLVAYVVYVRRQVRQAAAARRRRMAAARAAAARHARSEQLARLRAARERGAEPTGTKVVNGQVLIGSGDGSDRESGGWDPRPWPLPTYVTAPPAPPPAGTRVIDLTSSGSWSEGTAPERITVQAGDADPPEEALDDLTPRRYVVND